MARLTPPVYQHPSNRLWLVLPEEPKDSVEPDEDVDHVVGLRTGELPGVAQQGDVAGSQVGEGHLVRTGDSQ